MSSRADKQGRAHGRVRGGRASSRAVALVALASVVGLATCKSEVTVFSASQPEAGGTGPGSGGSGGGCVASPEQCNGLDDDCDGLVDEGDPGGAKSCETGLPGPCAAGETVCVGGDIECLPVTAVPEQCNGLDDDCDGTADQGDPGGGEPCDTGQPDECAAGETVCLGGVIECVAVAAVPEQCNGLDDDCNGVLDDPPACTRRVFVTSELYQGDLGGLDGADQKCQQLADAAGLGGSYKAWLSDPDLSAAERLTHVGKPYVLVDGVTWVAGSWADLTDGHIIHAIDLTELMTAPTWKYWTSKCGGPGGAEGVAVWTATDEDGSGTFDNPNDQEGSCFAWTSAEGTPPGPIPSARTGCTVQSTFGLWTYDSGKPCPALLALFCFEQ